MDFFLTILVKAAFLDVSLDASLSFYGLRFIDVELTKISIALLLQSKFLDHIFLFFILLFFLIHVLDTVLIFEIHRLIKLLESFFYLFVLIIQLCFVKYLHMSLRLHLSSFKSSEFDALLQSLRQVEGCWTYVLPNLPLEV